MSLRDSPEGRAVYAGVLAASQAVVTRHAKRRPPTTTFPTNFRPASLAEVPKLLAQPNGGPANAAHAREHFLQRHTGASLCHSFEDGLVPTGGYTEGLLTNDERKVAKTFVPGNQARVAALAKNPKTPSLGECRYCQLLFGLRYQNGLPPLGVVNHSAQISSDFAQGGTNVSEAGIKDFTMIVPVWMVDEIIWRNHPYNWPSAAPDLFKKVVGAEKVGASPRLLWRPGEDDPDPYAWRPGAEEYIYEIADMPWSDTISLQIENVIKVSNYHSHFAPGVKANGRKFIQFDYALERCVRSDYGIIGTELGGLDVDDGSVDVSAKPASDVDDHDLKATLPMDLEHLAQARGVTIQDPAKKRDAFDKILKHGSFDRDGSEPWLVTVSANKSLRYTVPRDAPPDIWAALTWMAPAILFVFMNRAVLQLPHTLLDPQTYKPIFASTPQPGGSPGPKGNGVRSRLAPLPALDFPTAGFDRPQPRGPKENHK